MAKLKTKKQELFCIEFAKTGNAGQSYQKAYGSKNEKAANAAASRLLNDVNIQERLRELADKAANDSIASIQEIKEFWTKVLRNEEVEEVVGVSNMGGPYQFSKSCDIKDRIKAAELLGRTSGLFIDKVEVSGSVPVKFVDDLEE